MTEVERHHGNGSGNEGAALAVDSQDVSPPSSVDLSASTQNALPQSSPAAAGFVSDEQLAAESHSASETLAAENQSASETVIIIDSSQSQDSPVPSSGDSIAPSSTKKQKKVRKLKKGENKKSSASQETKEKIVEKISGGTVWAQLGAFKCSKCGFTTTTENVYQNHICKSRKSTLSSSSSNLKPQVQSTLLPTSMPGPTEQTKSSVETASSSLIPEVLQPAQVGSDTRAASYPGYEGSAPLPSQLANTQVSQSSKQGSIRYMPSKNAYKCMQCGFEGRDNAFIEHLMYQVVATPYHCQYCKKSFSERLLLHKHFESEHPAEKRKCKLRNVSAIRNIMDRAKLQMFTTFTLRQTFQSCVRKQSSQEKTDSVPAQNDVVLPCSSSAACTSMDISTTSSYTTAASDASLLLSSSCDYSPLLERRHDSRVDSTAIKVSSVPLSTEHTSSLQTTPLSDILVCVNDKVVCALDEKRNDDKSFVGDKSTLNYKDFDGASNTDVDDIVGDTDPQLPIIISCQGNYIDHEEVSGSESQSVNSGDVLEGEAVPSLKKLEEYSNPVEVSSTVTVSLTSIAPSQASSSAVVDSNLTGSAAVVSVTSCSSLDHIPLPHFPHRPQIHQHEHQVVSQMERNPPIAQTAPLPFHTTSSQSRFTNVQPVHATVGLQTVLTNIVSQAAAQVSCYSLPRLPQTTAQNRAYGPLVANQSLGVSSLARFQILPMNHIISNNGQSIFRQVPQVQPHRVPVAFPMMSQSLLNPINMASCVRPGLQRTAAVQGTSFTFRTIRPKLPGTGLSQVSGSTNLPIETALEKQPSEVRISETENTFTNYSPISPASASPGPIYTPISPASPVFIPISPASPHRNYSPISPPLPQDCVRPSTGANTSLLSHPLDLTEVAQPTVSLMSAPSQSPLHITRRLDFVLPSLSVSETSVSVSGVSVTANTPFEKATSSSVSTLSKPSETSSLCPHIDIRTSGSVACAPTETATSHSSIAQASCLPVTVAVTAVGKMKQEKEDNDFQHHSLTLSTCPFSSSTDMSSGQSSVPLKNYFIKYKDTFACMLCTERFHDSSAFYVHVWNHQHADKKPCRKCCDAENQTSNQISCSETTQIVEAVSAITNARLLDHLRDDCTREKFTKRLLHQNDAGDVRTPQEDNGPDSILASNGDAPGPGSVEVSAGETIDMPVCNSPPEAQEEERGVETPDETPSTVVNETAVTVSSDNVIIGQEQAEVCGELNGDPAPCVVSLAQENSTVNVISDSEIPAVSKDSRQEDAQSDGDNSLTEMGSTEFGQGHDADKGQEYSAESRENKMITEGEKRSGQESAESSSTKYLAPSTQAVGETSVASAIVNAENCGILSSEEAELAGEDGGFQIPAAASHSKDTGAGAVSQQFRLNEDTDSARYETQTLAGEQQYDRSAVFFICSLCDFSCVLAIDFTMHLNSAHHNEPVFPCFHCNYQGQYTTDLTNHITAHTEGDSKLLYMCPCAMEVECSYRTDNLKTLGKHIQLHPGSTFWCHNCHTQFKDDTELLLHLTQNSMTLFSCSKCPARFLSRVTIQRHGKSEHFGGLAFRVMKVLLCKERKENNYKQPVNGLPIRRLSSEEELSCHPGVKNLGSKKPPMQALSSVSKCPAVDEVYPESNHTDQLSSQGSVVDTISCSETCVDVTEKGIHVNVSFPSARNTECSTTPVASGTSLVDQHPQLDLTMEQESASDLTVEHSECLAAVANNCEVSDETKKNVFCIHQDRMEKFRNLLTKIKLPKPQCTFVSNGSSLSEPVNVCDSPDDSPNCIIASVEKANMSEPVNVCDSPNNSPSCIIASVEKANMSEPVNVCDSPDNSPSCIIASVEKANMSEPVNVCDSPNNSPSCIIASVEKANMSEPVNVCDSPDNSPRCIIASAEKANTNNASPSESDVGQSDSVTDSQNVEAEVEVEVETGATDPPDVNEVVFLVTDEDEPSGLHNTMLESDDETTAKAVTVLEPEHSKKDTIPLRELFGGDQLHKLLFNNVYFKRNDMYFCPICDAKIQREKLVQEHLFGHYVPLVMCNLCRFSCSWKVDLEKHFGTDHQGKETFVCDLMVNKTILLNELKTSESLTIKTFGEVCHKISSEGDDNYYSSSSVAHVHSHIRSQLLKMNDLQEDKDAKKSKSASVKTGSHFVSENITSGIKPAAHFFGNSANFSVPGKSAESKEPGHCGVKSSTSSMIGRRRSSGLTRTGGESVHQKKQKSKEVLARPKPGTFEVVKKGAMSKLKCLSCNSLTLSPASMKRHLETCARYLNSQRDSEHTMKAESLAKKMRFPNDSIREQCSPEAVAKSRESKSETVSVSVPVKEQSDRKTGLNGQRCGSSNPKIHPQTLYKLGVSRNKSLLLPEPQESSRSQHMDSDTTSSKTGCKKGLRRIKVKRSSRIVSSSSKDEVETVKSDFTDKLQPKNLFESIAEALSESRETFQKVKQTEAVKSTSVLESGTSKYESLTLSERKKTFQKAKQVETKKSTHALDSSIDADNSCAESSDQQTLNNTEAESHRNVQDSRSVSNTDKVMVCHDRRHDEAGSTNEDLDSNNEENVEIQHICKCKYCDFSAPESCMKDLQGHMQQKHPQQLKLVKCGHCDYVYYPVRAANRLQVHTEKEHPGKNQLKETLALSYFYNSMEKENFAPKHKTRSIVSSVQRSEPPPEANDIEIYNKETTVKGISGAAQTGPKAEPFGLGSSTQQEIENYVKQTEPGAEATSIDSSYSNPVNKETIAAVRTQIRASSKDPEIELESTKPVSSSSQLGISEKKGLKRLLGRPTSEPPAKQSKKSDKDTEHERPLLLKDKPQQEGHKRSTFCSSGHEVSEDKFVHTPGKKRERSSRESRRAAATAAKVNLQAQMKGNSDSSNSSDDEFDIDLHKKQSAFKKIKRFAFLDTEEFKSNKKYAKKSASYVSARSSVPQKKVPAENTAYSNTLAPDGDPKASTVVTKASNNRISSEKQQTVQSNAASTPSTSTVGNSRPLKNTNYVCTICDQRHLDLRKITAHLTRHLNYCTIPCTWCSLEFMSVDDAKTHHRMKHKDKEYVMKVVRHPKMEIKLDKLILESKAKAMQRNAAAASSTPSDQAEPSNTVKVTRPQFNPPKQAGELTKSIQCRLCQCLHDSVSEFKEHFDKNHLDTGKEKEWVDVRSQNVYNLQGTLIQEGTSSTSSVLMCIYMCAFCSFRTNLRDAITEHRAEAHPDMGKWSLLLQTFPFTHIGQNQSQQKRAGADLSSSTSAVVTASPSSSTVSTRSTVTAHSSHYLSAASSSKAPASQGSVGDQQEILEHGYDVTKAAVSKAGLCGLQDQHSDAGKASTNSSSAAAGNEWEICQPVANDPKLKGRVNIQLRNILCPTEMRKLLLDNGIIQARLGNKDLSSKDRKSLESAECSL